MSDKITSRRKLIAFLNGFALSDAEIARICVVLVSTLQKDQRVMAQVPGYEIPSRPDLTATNRANAYITFALGRSGLDQETEQRVVAMLEPEQGPAAKLLVQEVLRLAKQVHTLREKNAKDAAEFAAYLKDDESHNS